MANDDELPPATPFTALLDGRARQGGTVTFLVPPDWMQGRTTFGGLTTSLALQAMRDVAGADWPARTLQTTFVGPVGGETSVEVRLLRQGRNMRQVQATVHSHGAVAAVVLGAFGVSRPTAVAVLRPEAPAVAKPPEELFEVPYLPGLTPRFARHLRSRWAEGEYPRSGKPSWLSRIFVRTADPVEDAELAAVLLADAPPSPVISSFDGPVPASSISWELELMTQPGGVTPDGWYRIDTEVLAAAEGYVSHRSQLFLPDGRLSAVGYQLVGVYG